MTPPATKRPNEIISGFAGSVVLAVHAFNVHQFTEDQLFAIALILAGLPGFITSCVETLRSFRADKVEKQVASN